MKTAMKITRLAMLMLPFALLSLIAFSQTAQKGYTVDPYIPKTPSVAALEKFIESPVSLHTGTQEVSVPVFQISLKNFSLPIALKYSTSGIKVEEFATDVGLGWSLQAGGALSSTVHGAPDRDWGGANYDFIQSYVNTNFIGLEYGVVGYEETEDKLDLYIGANDTDNLGLEFLKGVIRGVTDSEPDLYFFSAPGVPGRFFQDNTGFRPVPYQNIRIEPSVQGYTITDESGVEAGCSRCCMATRYGSRNQERLPHQYGLDGFALQVRSDQRRGVTPAWCPQGIIQPVHCSATRRPTNKGTMFWNTST